MARVSIAVTEAANQGAINPLNIATAANSASGMKFPNDGKTVLFVKNASGAAVTATAVSVADEAGRTGDLAVAVAAGNTAMLGPFKPAWWNQQATDIGDVYVDFSASANVTVAAYRLP